MRLSRENVASAQLYCARSGYVSNADLVSAQMASLRTDSRQCRLGWEMRKAGSRGEIRPFLTSDERRISCLCQQTREHLHERNSMSTPARQFDWLLFTRRRAPGFARAKSGKCWWRKVSNRDDAVKVAEQLTALGIKFTCKKVDRDSSYRSRLRTSRTSGYSAAPKWSSRFNRKRRRRGRS